MQNVCIQFLEEFLRTKLGYQIYKNNHSKQFIPQSYDSTFPIVVSLSNSIQSLTFPITFSERAFSRLDTVHKPSRIGLPKGCKYRCLESCFSWHARWWKFFKLINVCVVDHVRADIACVPVMFHFIFVCSTFSFLQLLRFCCCLQIVLSSSGSSPQVFKRYSRLVNCSFR